MNNMKPILLIILFLSLTLNVNGQYSHIKFKSDFERKVLTDLDKHSNIDVLLAISENGSDYLTEKVKSKINSLKIDLSNKKFENKAEEKQLKLLFDLTHKNFFAKYREITNFDKIFEAKEYNCVTATALYGLILEEYSIPYSIKETPTHVYIIAYPVTKSIILESTAPKDGYYYPNDGNVQKAVNSLVELKYYTKDEVEAKGVRNIYNEFFYSKDEIDLKKLAGLQYYNEAIVSLSEEKYEDALNSIYKSELLYPSDKTEYLSLILLANILNKTDFKDVNDIKYLTQYANLSIVEKDQIISAYNTIVNNNLFLESNVVLTDSVYHYLSGNLRDSTLMKDISEIHFSSFGRFYAQKSDYNRSLEYSTKAFEINPKNVNTQSLIAQSLVFNFQTRAGSPSTIKKMDEYMETFPFLKEHSLYQSLYFYSYAYNAFNHIRADDIDKGLEYLEQMESLIEKFGDELKYDENQYGMVYAEVGAAYYREHKYKKAKDIIEKGLSIMPDHPELKIRLEIVNEEMK